MADEFYIVDVRPEWRRHPYVTLWRPNDAGYAWPLPWAGRYHRDALVAGYHANKGGGKQYLRFPVPCNIVERLAIPTPTPNTVDGDAGPVLPNDAKTRRALRAARVMPECGRAKATAEAG
jgi:hypothetical protein